MTPVLPVYTWDNRCMYLKLSVRFPHLAWIGAIICSIVGIGVRWMQEMLKQYYIHVMWEMREECEKWQQFELESHNRMQENPGSYWFNWISNRFCEF